MYVCIYIYHLAKLIQMIYLWEAFILLFVKYFDKWEINAALFLSFNAVSIVGRIKKDEYAFFKLFMWSYSLFCSIESA